MVWMGENEDKLMFKTEFRLLFISWHHEKRWRFELDEIYVCVLFIRQLVRIFHNIDFLIKTYLRANGHFHIGCNVDFERQMIGWAHFHGIRIGISEKCVSTPRIPLRMFAFVHMFIYISKDAILYGSIFPFDLFKFKILE